MLLHCGPIIKFELCLSGLQSCSEIDQLILVSNNDLQDFGLHMCKGELYTLPSSLYSCLLKHLNIRSCILNLLLDLKDLTVFFPSIFMKLSLLKIRLISSCPLLEDLTLHSLASLDSLEVVGPNLKSVCCEGHFRSICFLNTSHLVSVSIYLKGSRNELLSSEGEIFTCH